MSILAFQLYRFIILPIALTLLKASRLFLTGKIRVMLDERTGPQWPAVSARPIVIHAASGEIEYAKPVIRAIKEIYPHVPIVVTYFSPSAKRLINDFPGIEFILPLPWDGRFNVQRFLKKYNPLMILYSRTDVWPELATQAKANHIPQLLFAATLTGASSRVKPPMRWLSTWAFSQLDEIHCVSPEDAQQFTDLNCNVKIKITGDSRYDQVLFRLSNPKSLRNFSRPHRPVFVAGSTWPEDEKVLIPVLNQWTNQGGVIMLAPHEVHGDHLVNIQRSLKSFNFNSTLYSQTKTWNENQILIIDEIGILQELYTWGALAFVGGSFKDKVHSVMEPLACGMPVIVGPHHQNNREALTFKNVQLSPDFCAVNVAENSEQLRQLMIRYSRLNREKMSGQIKSKIQSLSGASFKALSFVAANLSPSSKT